MSHKTVLFGCNKWASALHNANSVWSSILAICCLWPELLFWSLHSLN